ncbi:hypothetical protein Tco_0008553 [Tanacetum coccineum]
MLVPIGKRSQSLIHQSVLMQEMIQSVLGLMVKTELLHPWVECLHLFPLKPPTHHLHHFLEPFNHQRVVKLGHQQKLKIVAMASRFNHDAVVSTLEESRGVNLAWIIADHLYKHASGTKENSVIYAGHYVRKNIVNGLNTVSINVKSVSYG